MKSKGRGDSIIIELPSSPDEKRIGIIDCANFPIMKDYLENHVLPAKLEFVCITHPHADHMEGIQELLEYMPPIDPIWDPMYNSTANYALELRKYYKKKLMRFNIIRTGYCFKQLTPDDVIFEIAALAPDDDLVDNTDNASQSSKDINNSSVVLRIQYGKAVILITGDSQHKSWSRVTTYTTTNKVCNREVSLHAKILKVSHHGSIRGSHKESFEDVTASLAIITGEDSIDAPNEYPHEDVLKWLKEVHTNVILCTHDSGHIVVECLSTGRYRYASFESNKKTSEF